MATLSHWNLSRFTPLSPSSTMCSQMPSMASCGTRKSNSPRAKLSTSLRDSMPSASLSYFSKRSCMSLVASLAAARCTAFAFAPLACLIVLSAMCVQSLIRCSSCAKTCFVSDSGIGWPGTSWPPGTTCAAASASFISGPLARMKSVQAFVICLDVSTASSAATDALSTSCTKCEESSCSSGAAITFSFSAWASAASTRSQSSFTRRFTWSSASLRLFSSAILFSSSARFCAVSCSMRFLACSIPLSLSSFIRCTWAPVFVSSSLRTSSNSEHNSAKFSGVASRTFWMTLLIASVDFCSARRFSSSSLLRFISSSFRLTSASFCLTSSSSRLF
mmetsp:Transcript_73758/g.139325  ORF Transcript_73758/g.139325 Transcript_73758/m.139325 type:complete len:333 (-) Transcript_73758:549-1547(-)